MYALPAGNVLSEGISVVHQLSLGHFVECGLWCLCLLGLLCGHVQLSWVVQVYHLHGIMEGIEENLDGYYLQQRKMQYKQHINKCIVFFF